MASLTAFEHTLFHWINSQASHKSLDPLMQLLSSEAVWLSGGLVVVLALLIKGSPWVRKACVCGLAIMALCDGLSYRVLKPYFDRKRPCYQEDSVRLVADGCGSQQGFPSNHASNGMAAATLVYLCSQRRLLWPFVVAGLVGYSRIYVGVHYPFDVLMGFGLGGLLGLAGFLLLLGFERLQAAHRPQRS